MIEFINKNINIISSLGVIIAAVSFIYPIIKNKKKRDNEGNLPIDYENRINIHGNNNLNNSNISQNNNTYIDKSQKKIENTFYNILDLKSVVKSIEDYYVIALRQLSSSNNSEEIALSNAIKNGDMHKAKNILNELIKDLEDKVIKHDHIKNSHESYISNYKKMMAEDNLKIATIASLLKLDIAGKYFDEAMNLSDGNPSVPYAYSLYLNFNGEYEKAISLCHEMIKMFSLSDGDKQVIYGNLGVFYKNISDWENAELYQKKSLSIAESRNDIRGQITIKNNIAVLLNNKEKYTEAYNILLETLPRIDDEINIEVDSDIKNSLRILKSDILTNIVISLKRKSAYNIDIESRNGNLKKALNYINEAIDISEMINEPVKIITNYGNASNIYKELMQFEKCEKFINLALNKSIEIKNKKLIALSKYNLSLLYIEIDKLPEAKEICLSLIENKENIHGRLLPDIYHTLAYIDYLSKMFNSSLKYCDLASNSYKELQLDKALSVVEELKQKMQ
ncbi:tetratricopeptide repeat protein [Yersinia pseudotuberculosis]|uniref:tetratricopeptide repeat protein n=1 Tax=Yersinia pseudotuberculosis TaxID=633 RepID=UPI001FB72232|nr:hypothetical protein [Yersinia pseudotuberculosis]